MDWAHGSTGRGQRGTGIRRASVSSDVSLTFFLTRTLATAALADWEYKAHNKGANRRLWPSRAAEVQTADSSTQQAAHNKQTNSFFDGRFLLLFAHYVFLTVLIRKTSTRLAHVLESAALVCAFAFCTIARVI